MASFINNAITDDGRLLLGEVQMGAVFTPTKIVLGSGRLPSGTTVRTIKNVVYPVITLQINKKKKSNDGNVVIGGVYSNESITSDFYFRELALYAKAVKLDGTEVPEVLYSYGNAGEAADYMPAYTSGTPVERQIDIATYIGNDTQIDMTIESGIFITREQAEEIVADAVGDFFVKRTGDTMNGPLYINENIVLTGLTNNVTLYVGPTGSDTTGDGSSAKPFNTIAKALSVLPKILNGKTVTITVAAGTYSEARVDVSSFTDGELIITGTSASTKPTISNGISVNKCSAAVTLKWLNLTSSSSGAQGAAIASCQQATIDTCAITSATTQQNHGILIDSMSTAYIVGTHVTNCNYAVLSRASKVIIQSISGGGNRIGFYSTNGGDIRIRESSVVSTGALYFTEYGGRVYMGAQVSAPNY